MSNKNTITLAQFVHVTFLVITIGKQHADHGWRGLLRVEGSRPERTKRICRALFDAPFAAVCNERFSDAVDLLEQTVYQCFHPGRTG
jgi:hypothetical protein